MWVTHNLLKRLSPFHFPTNTTTQKSQLYFQTDNITQMACSSTPLLSPPTTTTITTINHHHHHTLQPIFPIFTKSTLNRKLTTRLQVSSSPTSKPTTQTQNPNQETIFFDGGAHYGDLITNLLLGFTLVWLPLTLAAVQRALYLRYRFTNLRVSVISGLTGEDRSDFSYSVIKDVQVVPRFIGEWGDIVITLKDGTKIDLRSVPKFREIAKYCLSMKDNSSQV
jgi:hypothetical protein